MVRFLHDQRSDVRQIALLHIVEYSRPGKDLSIFRDDNYRPLKDIKLLTREKKTKTVKNSVTILNNLCVNKEFRDLVVNDESFIKYLVEQILKFSNVNADIECLLLSNLARDERVLSVNKINVSPATDLQKSIFKSTNALDCLMDIFVKGSGKKLNKDANFNYLAYFFGNIAQFKDGRKYLTEPREYDGQIPLGKLLPFTEYYESTIRRQGVASAIKNCLFDTDRQMPLLEDTNIHLLESILRPLTFGNNKGLKKDEIKDITESLKDLSIDKKVEPEMAIRAIHLESILLLCVTRLGRDYLRERKIYPLIREIDKDSKDQEVGRVAYEIVNMLMRDEQLPKDKYDPKKEREDIHRIMEDKKNVQDHVNDEEFDSDDDEIVEVA